ncbi:MAG: dipeptidase [Lachnospiraceae bacterium]
MNLIDMHCDTLLKLMDDRIPQNLMDNNCCVSIEKLKKAGASAQFFACFIDMKQFSGADCCEQGYDYAMRMLTRLKDEIKQYPDDIAMAGNYAEYISNNQSGKITAFATIEEGGIIHDDRMRIQTLYNEGIRLITLLWNYENCMGYPNSKEERIMNAGLKPFGFETIEQMNELGMIVDVSHLSDGGFWDTVKYSKHPVAASHSNARALRNHPRNLSDEMLRALAEAGGVAGLNFYHWFLGESQDTRIEQMTAHVLHMMRVGGEEAVAIGTDFDGFDIEGVIEIPDIGEIGRLAAALGKAGVTQRQLDKIWSENVLRLIREVL